MKTAFMMDQKNWLMMLILFPAAFFTFSCGLAEAEDRKPQLKSVGEQYFENTRKGDMWTKSRSKRFAASSEVKNYFKSLNEGQFSDWRLPTKQELYDLFMIFDAKNNGDIKVRIEGKYWLANNAGQMSVGAWTIGDGCGPERTFSQEKKGFVRAIRP